MPAQGRPLYGIDPSRLPSLSYAFDPDTGDGYLRLSWSDPDGTSHWRQYDTSGMRNDGQSQAGGNDLVRDFFYYASDAVLPAWEADTRFRQHSAGAQARPADGGELFLGDTSADGATLTRSVLTLGGATEETFLDLDGDGYLESTHWTRSPNQFVYSVMWCVMPAPWAALVWDLYEKGIAKNFVVETQSWLHFWLINAGLLVAAYQILWALERWAS